MIAIISEFIESQSCAAICCVDEDGSPYCFNCFYVYNHKEQLLYYKSSLDTRHSGAMVKYPKVAGTILPDQLNKGHIVGVQFQGISMPFGHSASQNAAAIFYKKNPHAEEMPGEIWTIRLVSVKYTDSALGLGKKMIWERNFEEETHS
jgi:uncharacterized protein